MEQKLKDTYILGTLYSALAEYGYTGWSCALALFVGLQFRGNALSVNKVIRATVCVVLPKEDKLDDKSVRWRW